MAKVTTIRPAAKTDAAHEAVLAGDVRAHLARVLTMLDEAQNLLAPGDERSLTLAEGLLSSARGKLREFSEHLC